MRTINCGFLSETMAVESIHKCCVPGATGIGAYRGCESGPQGSERPSKFGVAPKVEQKSIYLSPAGLLFNIRHRAAGYRGGSHDCRNGLSAFAIGEANETNERTASYSGPLRR